MGTGMEKRPEVGHDPGAQPRIDPPRKELEAGPHEERRHHDPDPEKQLILAPSLEDSVGDGLVGQRRNHVGGHA